LKGEKNPRLEFQKYFSKRINLNLEKCDCKTVLHLFLNIITVQNFQMFGVTYNFSNINHQK